MSRCAPGQVIPWPLSTDLMVKYIANRAAKNISSEESQMMVPTLTRFGLLAGVRGLVWTVAVATRPLLRQPVGDRYATPRIGCRSRYDACHEGRCVQPRRRCPGPDQARHRASPRDGRAGRGNHRGRHRACPVPAARRGRRRRDGARRRGPAGRRDGRMPPGQGRDLQLPASAAGHRARRRRLAGHLVARRRRDQPSDRSHRAGPRTGRPDAGPRRNHLNPPHLLFFMPNEPWFLIPQLVYPCLPPGAAMDARTTWPALLGALIRGDSLTADESEWAMNEIMDGAATPSQIAGFGVALRIKGTSIAEMTGLARAMLAHATPIHVTGHLTDLVGTGGDGAQTVNVSTMGTIVAAAAGVRMVKHGNRAASSACGAADVLEALGVIIDLPPAATAELADEVGVAFLFAPLYHPALRYAGPTRSELGVPTVFNFLGPVANPARPTAQAVGVFDPVMGGVIAGVLAGRGCSALVFHGSDGLDELTTTGPSTMWVVHDGQVAQTEFSPETLGLPPASVADLRGGDAARNAAVARAVLAGERGPVRDIVLLNAAAALAASAGVPGPDAVPRALADGYARAAEAVDSGAARVLLDRWIEVSHRLDPKGGAHPRGATPG